MKNTVATSTPTLSGNTTWTFQGVFDCALPLVPEVEKIILNGDTTIVCWKDGTKTKSTASIEDVVSPEVGSAMCLLKKLYGKKVYGRKQYRRLLMKAETQDFISKKIMKTYLEEVKRKESEDKRKKENGKKK